MEALVDRLEDLFRRHPQHGADSRGDRGGEVGDVVDFVFVQADPGHKRHLCFVGGGDSQGKFPPAAPGLLRDREEAGDGVAGMGIVRGEVAVVHVQLAHGHPVGEGRPLAVEAALAADSEQRGAGPFRVGVAEGEQAGVAHRVAVDGGDGDRGVVDEAVADHPGDLGFEGAVACRHGGDLPGELLLPGENGPFGMCPYDNGRHQRREPAVQRPRPGT